jgi:hypothetical protein
LKTNATGVGVGGGTGVGVGVGRSTGTSISLLTEIPVLLVAVRVYFVFTVGKTEVVPDTATVPTPEIEQEAAFNVYHTNDTFSPLFAGRGI